MGYTSINTIFYVDGGLFIFGVIGLFMLLKVKFNDLESFLGGLLYATFPILLTILAVGFSDISSVSFSIWAIYFMVLAVKKDSRFFYLAFPFAMFAFLTRYNNALLIFPIFLYILINKDKVNFKNIILGIVASILVIIPVLIFFNEKFGNIIYTFMNFESTSTVVSGSIESAVYNPNIFFYIQMFPRFVGPQGITIMLIILLGTFLYLVLYFIRNNRDNKKLFEEMRLNKYKLILFFVLGIIFLASFGKIVYMISEILFFIFVYIFYEITKIYKFKNLELHLIHHSCNLDFAA